MSSSIYLLVSLDEFIIDNKIKKIIEKNKTSDTEIVKYDLKEIPIERVVEDLDTYNFLCSKKIIVANNAYFLTPDKPKLAVEHDISKFLKYLNNPSSENILIISCSKLDNRKKITEVITKVSKLVDMEVNLNTLVKKELEDYVMDNDTISFFLEYVSFDSARCISELEKLKLYKFDDKKITKEDIELIVSKTVDDNSFSLADAIIKKNKEKAIEIYQAMILHNQQATDIIPLVASKFRLMYQVKILSKIVYSDDDIARMLGVKKYPVTITKEVAVNYSGREILNLLNQLAELDYNIKTNNIYEKIAFEQFILSL